MKAIALNWNDERRNSVGASEVAAVVGMSKYRTAFDVWQTLVDGIEVEDNDDMKAGRVMEPHVVWALSQATGENFRPCGQTLYRRPDLPFMHATPDAATPGFATLGEVKMTSHYMDYAWKDNGELGYPAPDYYVVQVFAQIIVSDVNTGRLGAFFADAKMAKRFAAHYASMTATPGTCEPLVRPEEITHVRIERPSQSVITDIVEMVKQFWFDHVVTKVPPGPEWIQNKDLLADYAKKRYERERQAALLLNGVEAEGAMALARKVAAAREKERIAKAERDAAETDLKLLIGDHVSLYANDASLATWKTQGGQCDWKKVALNLADWTGTPRALVEEAAKETQSKSRVLRVKGINDEQ